MPKRQPFFENHALGLLGGGPIYEPASRDDGLPVEKTLLPDAFTFVENPEIYGEYERIYPLDACRNLDYFKIQRNYNIFQAINMEICI